MNHHLRVPDERQQVVGNLAELRLVLEEVSRQAVHGQRTLVAGALGVNVVMETLLCDTARDHFDRADFDDAVTFPGL